MEVGLFIRGFSLLRGSRRFQQVEGVNSTTEVMQNKEPSSCVPHSPNQNYWHFINIFNELPRPIRDQAKGQSLVSGQGTPSTCLPVTPKAVSDGAHCSTPFDPYRVAFSISGRPFCEAEELHILAGNQICQSPSFAQSPL